MLTLSREKSYCSICTCAHLPGCRDWSLAALSLLSQQEDSPERDTLAVCPALLAIQHLFQESLPQIN